MNFYKHHIGDYAQATAHLSFVEDAAYSRLIRKYYAEEQPLLGDLKAVQRLVGARTKEEKSAVDLVLQEFFHFDGESWRNKRCDDELAQWKAQAETNRRIAIEREARKAKKSATVNEHEPSHEPPNEPLNDSLASREPNQNPESRIQNPEVNQNQLTLVSDKSPACPHLEIIELYNRILPELPAVVPSLWDGARKIHLQTRWRESAQHQSLEFWERFFNALRKHDFYLGKNDRGWRANLAWLIEKKHFTDMVEKFIATSKQLNGTHP